MQSSSAEGTMMESQKRKRASAWTEWEVRDLIAVWGKESVLSELRSSFRNAKTFVKISQGMKDKGHNRDPKQCHVKLKELRQAYQKTREANGHSGVEWYLELRSNGTQPDNLVGDESGGRRLCPDRTLSGERAREQSPNRDLHRVGVNCLEPSGGLPLEWGLGAGGAPGLDTGPIVVYQGVGSGRGTGETR
ncbi:hypothetical protein UY3_17572 [Chelonia mydas]|uniref:Myb/SANT-like DNA-binding domain-containing protein n=1 Tax=Chelonia mydas TaxID=8469 RepID=M7AJW2_CHEMY|nr:hypothetical protein UY3_17572 [Chelonia mydas]